MGVINRNMVEAEEKWREWIDRIPAIRFPRNWEVQVIPPFAGVLARFRVRHGQDFILVYLDVFDTLGYFGGPYWEVYPSFDGDPDRCAVENVGELVRMISKAKRRK